MGDPPQALWREFIRFCERRFSIFLKAFGVDVGLDASGRTAGLVPTAVI
jgi:hypothetical protein